MIPQYTDRNRRSAKGGPSSVQRSYASQFKESEALFTSYEHLQGLQRGDAALKMLRQVASLVKPIMRKRGWRVQILAEFLPPEQNLLGLNVNKGYKICIRLRYHNNPDLFLPVEQVVDTMLHELSHIVWGEHDSNFHQLWEELRDEHETLVRKGYTGEGFLSEGHTLGGGGRRGLPPPQEMRRLARASAEKRQAQGTLSKGSGQRLGGTPLHLQGGDVRRVIAEQASRRNTINKGCASGRQDATKLSEQSANNTFKTKADEDDANDRAIAQALFELMELEEERKINGTFSAAPTNGGLAWTPEHGLYDPKNEHRPSPIEPKHMSEEEQLKWALRDSTSADPTFALSPVSPLTPAVALSNTAPPVPMQPKPDPVSGKQLSYANKEPVSRPTGYADEAEAHQSQQNSQTTLANSVPTTNSATMKSPVLDISEPFNPNEWSCDICTCINPVQFLACDACGTERPQGVSAPVRPSSTRISKPRWAIPKIAHAETLGWNCGRCGSFMEHKWWTCSACGTMKDSS